MRKIFKLADLVNLVVNQQSSNKILLRKKILMKKYTLTEDGYQKVLHCLFESKKWKIL